MSTNNQLSGNFKYWVAAAAIILLVLTPLYFMSRGEENEQAIATNDPVQTTDTKTTPNTSDNEETATLPPPKVTKKSAINVDYAEVFKAEYQNYNQGKATVKDINLPNELGFAGKNVKVQLAKTLEHYNNGELQTALPDLSILINKLPDAKELYLYRGCANLTTGKENEALKDFLEARKSKNTEIVQTAEWNFALLTGKMGNAKQANSIIAMIAGKEGKYQEAAKKMMNKK